MVFDRLWCVSWTCEIVETEVVGGVQASGRAPKARRGSVSSHLISYHLISYKYIYIYLNDL